MAALPTLDLVRTWVDVTESACSDEQLQAVMDGEAANQAKACRIADPDDRDADLIQAYYRRIARVLAARGVPLGTTSGEQGPIAVSRLDAEIERLEGYDRKFNVG